MIGHSDCKSSAGHHTLLSCWSAPRVPRNLPTRPPEPQSPHEFPSHLSTSCSSAFGRFERSMCTLMLDGVFILSKGILQGRASSGMSKSWTTSQRPLLTPNRDMNAVVSLASPTPVDMFTTCCKLTRCRVSQDTGAKPYVCRECNRSFSRQDSLARHEKLHARRRATRDAASPSPLVDKPVTPESVQSIDPSEENGSEFSSAARSVVPGSASTTTHPPPVTQSVDLDFDLIWPDSEDLFQTIMSSDAANQWQIPLGTLPFSASPSASEGPFGTPRSFDHRPASIGSIPSGGNHQAVQDVSKMISNLVCYVPLLEADD